MAMRLTAAAAAAGVFAAPFAAPALGLDQIVKLYMCQTEHELRSINAWENSDPAKFLEATKNRTVMPVDAAMDRAARMVSLDRIACDAGGRVTVDKSPEGSGTPSMAVLEGAELDSYCPITIRKHGLPCK